MLSRAVIAAILAALVSVSYADSSYVGKITKVHTGPTGNLAFIVLDQDQNGRPECANYPQYNYVFDISTDGGKATLSLALTAYTTGAEVYVGGSQSCNLWTGAEDLKWIRLQ